MSTPVKHHAPPLDLDALDAACAPLAGQHWKIMRVDAFDGSPCFEPAHWDLYRTVGMLTETERRTRGVVHAQFSAHDVNVACLLADEEATARFIALANPATVAQLVARVRAAKAVREASRG